MGKRFIVNGAITNTAEVVGHSFICYAPLLAGATTVLFEGKPIGTPDAGSFWRIVEEHKVHFLRQSFSATELIRCR